MIQKMPNRVAASRASLAVCLILVTVLVALVVSPSLVGAQSAVDTSGLPKLSANSTSPINTVLQIVFGIMGSVALLMIVLAGFKYITAQGEPDKLNKAKDTIIYAAIGLAISLSAYTIVTTVINRL